MEDIYIPPRRRRRKRRPGWPFYLIAALALVAILVGVTGIILHTTNEYKVELTLSGEVKMQIEYGEVFRDPGASAVGFGTVFRKNPRPLEVLAEGSVDASKLGIYEIRYSADFEGVHAEAVRQVQVVDTKPPVITLVSDPDHYTLPGQSYEEEGYSASDNYDGDITSRVTREEKEGRVIYRVSDSSGNETIVTRDIVYKDPEAPKLTLQGKDNVSIVQGTAWKEPGYTAVDNVDGDITDRVKVTGTVDVDKPGTYTLTYEVTDEAGNRTVVQRKVQVNALPPSNPQDKPDSNQGQGNVIYLTFDDGPGAHTERLLSVLKKYNVKATFFVCKTYYDMNTLNDIVAGGHSLGLHSVSHRYEQIYSSEEAYFADLYGIQDLVYQHTGVKSWLMRFPGGSSNGVSKNINPGIMSRLTKAVQEKGFHYFDWNVDSNDAGGAKDAATVANNVINGISKRKSANHVVLQHDIYGYSVDAVERIIQWGLANGYTFKALSENSPTCHHKVQN